MIALDNNVFIIRNKRWMLSSFELEEPSILFVKCTGVVLHFNMVAVNILINSILGSSEITNLILKRLTI